MNITFPADKEIVKKTRDYATRHGTTMNRMIRGLMERMTGAGSREGAASEFERLALNPFGSCFDPDVLSR